jgi:thiol:disulfide interchange protein DsbD
LWKGLGLVVVIYGGVMLLGAAGGGNDLMQPLKGMTLAGGGAGGGAQPQLVFRYVKGPEGLSAALTEARAQGRPAMLDFYADWCISCKEMEKYTFSDPAVQAALSNAVLLKTDVTANDAQDQALLKQFRLIGPPAILFFTAGGEELSRSRVVGYMKAEPFAAHVRAAVGG